MLAITLDNREEIENEYMALLLNKNELFDVTQIRPQYLSNSKNQKLFEYCKECYEEYKVVSPMKIYEKHKDINFEWMMDLMINTFYYNNAWKEQLKVCEESIVRFYKEDLVKVMNEKLERKQISYDGFIQKMRQLDDIELIRGSNTVDKEELLTNINIENIEIRLNKFNKLNNFLKLVQGDFLIIGATTGAGKSGFMLNLMIDLMERYQCIYFNMEMSKSTIYKRLISIEANIKIDDILNPQSEYQRQLIEKAIDKIENAGIVIEHKANDIKQIKNLLIKMKDKNRHTILFIDHLGLTRADNTKSLYEQATEVAKQLRQMCLEYDCTIISASQLNRGAYQSERPSLAMLKDSGELENSASKVILLYRDEKDKNNITSVNQMNVEIVKNRDGVTGYVEMEYDKTKQIFNEVNNYDNRNGY
ncbi:MAG: DnaB-like helicase C-terminal domain-containing protein [Bacilli bacterium]